MAEHESEAQATPMRRESDYERGRREEKMATRVDEHERRLNALNGNLGNINERLGRMEAAMATETAVADAIAKVAKDTGAKRYTRWQIVGIIVLSLAAIGAFVLSLITTLAAG